MRHFFTILGHEIRMLLVNPSTYLAVMLFLVFMGFIFTGILEDYSREAREVSPAYDFFRLFWLPMLFIVPLLTMKSISEERRQGTLETLLTTPVSTVEVVFGKFGAIYFLYLLCWGSTGGLFYLLHRSAADPRLLDPGVLLGGYLFLAVSGLFFVAVGLFTSSLARNQAVAAILAFVLLALLVFGPRLVLDIQMMQLEAFRPAQAVLEYAQVFQHLEDFSRGIVDTRELSYYLSGTTLALIFSILGVEARLLHH